MNAPAKSSVRRQRKQILLVDDDELIRHLRATILGNLGHEVTQAVTVEQARSRWMPGRYDLVIVDLKNSVEAAMEFCEELKRESPEQMVAFLTPRTIYVRPNSCPDEVIEKDEGPAQFVSQVQELLAS